MAAGWNSGREVPSGQHGHGQPGDRTPDAFQEFLGELARGEPEAFPFSMMMGQGAELSF